MCPKAELCSSCESAQQWLVCNGNANKDGNPFPFEINETASPNPDSHLHLSTIPTHSQEHVHPLGSEGTEGRQASETLLLSLPPQ